jgi:hypothetical protein
MPSAIILAMAFAGPLPVDSTGAAVLRSPDEIQHAYRDVMQQSSRRAQPDYADVVPRMAELYVELAATDGVSHAERSRMRGCLKVRLEDIRNRLARADLEQREQARRAARRDRVAARDRTGEHPSSSIGGPLDEPNARVLIDLIQNTIAPESWEVNGGRGSIRYYSLYQALVVRQTGEVHHQLGGGLEQFRK